MRRNRGTIIVTVALIAVSMMISACDNQKVTGRGKRPRIEVVRKKYSSDVIPHKRTLAAGGLQYYWDNQTACRSGPVNAWSAFMPWKRIFMI